ncbi:MAG: potassium transporter TrkH [Rhodobacterales bacterium]|nr:MAG: potassium transporter TrkH [Rhodobacterales bacterium]
MPLVVLVVGVGGLAMLLPGAHAAWVGDARVAEIFLLYGVLTLLGGALVGLAQAGRRRSDNPRRHLGTLFALFVALPLLFALPFQAAVQQTTFLNAYVEMVSALTTTGATLFDDAGRLSDSLHLWRAVVAWMGGLFIWVGAVAVLAPMSLGGFELRVGGGQQGVAGGPIQERADLSARVRRFTVALAPLYIALTALVAGLLVLAGDAPLAATIHAMSTLSTSGITLPGGVSGAGAGMISEVIVAVFLLFALSRATFSYTPSAQNASRFDRLRHDPEIRMAAALITIVPAFLFFRHFIGAYEVAGAGLNLAEGIGALWGSVFTVLSFLTTAGFESAAWQGARSWSGLETPGLILAGLALFGGGVATTAGGAKLLRVYALYRHGLREMEKLVHPNSVGGGGTSGILQRGAAFRAWLFFMLMTLSLAIVMMAFAWFGAGFERAMILSISALTTTGPLLDVAAQEPVHLGLISVPEKLVYTGAMVLGRLETLAIVALFSPDLWRR